MRKEGGYTCVCPHGYTGNISFRHKREKHHIINPHEQLLKINYFQPILVVNCEMVLKKASCSTTGEVCKGGSQCSVRREGGILCQGCRIDSNHTTDLCELRARSFTRTSFLTFASLKQRHRMHIKLK